MENPGKNAQENIEITIEQPIDPGIENNQNLEPEKPKFDEDLIVKYPRSNRKMSVNVLPYGLKFDEDPASHTKGQTQFISPYGMQFQGNKAFEEGQLLKIHVNLPDYWIVKQHFVDYRRVDTPGSFRILAKVVRIEDLGKRGKKKMVVVQTVNMDEIDERVLKAYLQES
jgi:hypothetical protein